MPSVCGAHNGEACSNWPESFKPSQLLLEHPNAVYTSALVDAERGGIVDWELHLDRLTSTIKVLSEARSETLQRFRGWSQEQGLADDGALVLRTAVEENARIALGNAKRDSCGDLMLLILVEDAPSCEPASRNDNAAPLSVWAVACSVHRPPPSVAVTAGVMGPPRSLPSVKHASWASERRPLEARKTDEMAEVILSDEEGGLMEGLVTNFFVVARGVDGAPVVVSAPSRSVLPGTVMRRISECCAEVGVPFECRAPKLQEYAEWTEAFLTNAIRGIQPVATLLVGESSDINIPFKRIDLPNSDTCPVTTQLQAALQRLQTISSAI